MNYNILQEFCINNNIDFIHKNITSSTMDLANKENNDERYKIFLAEEQTNGRGRNNNKWVSQKNNIFITYKIPYFKSLTNHYNLSILSCLVIIETIQEYKINFIKIKWPNDIYIDNSKVGGILIEFINDVRNNLHYILLGIGINFANSPNLTKYKTTYLKKINHNINKDVFLTNLTKKMINRLKYWIKDNKINEITNYKNYLMYIGEKVKMHTSEKIYEGIFLGINENGFAVLKNKNKKIILMSGEMYK